MTSDNRIRITGPDGTFAAYVARPRVTPAPAIVVIHEVFGVNSDLRQACDELAAIGYLAVCPDLFWRLEPGLELTDRTDAELAKALKMYNAFDLDAGVVDITATLRFVRTMAGSNGKAGMVGYCLGGLLAYLTTARAGADAAVAYYPGNADQHLAEAGGVTTPLMVHIGEEDEYIPKEAQRRIAAALRERPRSEVHTYPGCRHAFARHQGTAYDRAAAALANGRTAAFLARYLNET